ncbi:MAG: Abi family protein [Saprospiraceae bacterium]|nr:Abi family protein [Saprospiraceae bacterium]
MNYWYPFLEGPKTEEIFKPETSFETIFSIYQFDSELRKTDIQAIEQNRNCCKNTNHLPFVT